MEEEKMLVPSGLKTVDGKDIMCYTGAFYLKNEEKIKRIIKKCEEILDTESEDIKETSDGILKNLAFLFVPAGVGILANVDVIKGKIFQIIILVIIGTIISMALTGLVVQFLQRRKDA